MDGEFSQKNTLNIFYIIFLFHINHIVIIYLSIKASKTCNPNRLNNALFGFAYVPTDWFYGTCPTKKAGLVRKTLPSTVIDRLISKHSSGSNIVLAR